jgi:hypothetical protein
MGLKARSHDTETGGCDGWVNVVENKEVCVKLIRGKTSRRGREILERSTSWYQAKQWKWRMWGRSVGVDVGQ